METLLALARRRFPLIAVLVIAVAMPLFLIAANVRIVTESGWFYTYAFDRYEVSERTGIEPRELRRVADEIKAYFRSGEERLDVRATVYGDERDLFSEREILHMIDVKRLMRGVSLIERVSFYTMAGLALALLALVGRRAALLAVGRGLVYGAALSFAILIALGIGLAAGFDALFTRFHVISFANDLWLLDPRRDFLVMIFPEAFFRDATLAIAGLTLGQAALTGGVVYALRRRAARALSQSPPEGGEA